MVYAGSSSHPKRQANYNTRQRPYKSLNGASPRWISPSRSHGLYDLTRRHRLIIWVLHSRFYSPRYLSSIPADSRLAIPQLGSYRSLLSPLIQIPMPRDRWTSAGPPLDRTADAAADSRSPRAMHVFYADHLLRSRSRFRKSQSSEEKSIIVPYCYLLPYLLIVLRGNWM